MDVLGSPEGIAGAIKLLRRCASVGADSDERVEAERRLRCCLLGITDGAAALTMRRRTIELEAVLELLEIVGALLAPDTGTASFARDVGAQGMALHAMSRLATPLRPLPARSRSGPSATRLEHVFARIGGYMTERIAALVGDADAVTDSALMAMSIGRWFDDNNQAAPDGVIGMALAMMRHPAFNRRANCGLLSH